MRREFILVLLGIICISTISSLLSGYVQTESDKVLLDTVAGSVGAGNFSYWQLGHIGPLLVELTSLTGDADLYVADMIRPGYEVDQNNFSSVTCGPDLVNIPPEFPRPVGIGVFGHWSHEHSQYSIQVFLRSDEAPAPLEEPRAYDKTDAEKRRDKRKGEEEPKPRFLKLLNILDMIFDIIPFRNENETTFVWRVEFSRAYCGPLSPLETPCTGDPLRQIASRDEMFHFQDVVASLSCRTIRIGTYKYTPKEKVIISSKGIKIVAPSLKDETRDVALQIPLEHIIRISAYFSKDVPAIFFSTWNTCADHIRNVLDMTDESGPYYNPLITKSYPHLRITLLPESISDETKMVLKALFSFNMNKLIPQEANEIFSRLQIFIYPRGKGGIAIDTKDYMCLAQDQFLNEVIIDFYLKYLYNEVLTDSQRVKTHIFNAYFYERLTTKPSKVNEETWTKNVNIFDKDFIVVPIKENRHWFVAVICHPGLEGCRSMIDNRPVSPQEIKERERRSSMQEQLTLSCVSGNLSERDETETEESDLDMPWDSDEEDEVAAAAAAASEKKVEPPQFSKTEPIKQPCILIFDSLAGASRSKVVETLRDYLTCEYQTRVKISPAKIFNKDNIKESCPEIPQQNNVTDSGLYLLQYVEQFFKDPVKDYALPIKQLSNWFDEIVVTRKREEISLVLRLLMIRYDPYSRLTLPDIAFPTLNGAVGEGERPGSQHSLPEPELEPVMQPEPEPVLEPEPDSYEGERRSSPGNLGTLDSADTYIVYRPVSPGAVGEGERPGSQHSLPEPELEPVMQPEPEPVVEPEPDSYEGEHRSSPGNLGTLDSADTYIVYRPVSPGAVGEGERPGSQHSLPEPELEPVMQPEPEPVVEPEPDSYEGEHRSSPGNLGTLDSADTYIVYRPVSPAVPMEQFESKYSEASRNLNEASEDIVCPRYLQMQKDRLEKTINNLQKQLQDAECTIEGYRAKVASEIKLKEEQKEILQNEFNTQLAQTIEHQKKLLEQQRNIIQERENRLGQLKRKNEKLEREKEKIARIVAKRTRTPSPNNSIRSASPNNSIGSVSPNHSISSTTTQHVF